MSAEICRPTLSARGTAPLFWPPAGQLQQKHIFWKYLGLTKMSQRQKSVSKMRQPLHIPQLLLFIGKKAIQYERACE